MQEEEIMENSKEFNKALQTALQEIQQNPWRHNAKAYSFGYQTLGEKLAIIHQCLHRHGLTLSMWVSAETLPDNTPVYRVHMRIGDGESSETFETLGFPIPSPAEVMEQALKNKHGVKDVGEIGQAHSAAMTSSKRFALDTVFAMYADSDQHRAPSAAPSAPYPGNPNNPPPKPQPKPFARERKELLDLMVQAGVQEQNRKAAYEELALSIGLTEGPKTAQEWGSMLLAAPEFLHDWGTAKDSPSPPSDEPGEPQELL